MANSKSQNHVVNRVFYGLTLIAMLVFVTIGGLALWANRFTTNMVKAELSSQKIYFPAKGSPAPNDRILGRFVTGEMLMTALLNRKRTVADPDKPEEPLESRIDVKARLIFQADTTVHKVENAPPLAVGSAVKAGTPPSGKK